MVHDVAVLGGFGIDTNVFLSGGINMTHEGNFSTNLDYPGQAGNFSAHSYAQLGLRTIALAALGSDLHGNWIQTELEAQNIDVIRIEEPSGTKRSVNIMGEDGSRINFYDAKGSMAIELDPRGQYFNKLFQTKLVHVNILNWARHFLPQMKANGQIIATDIQDVKEPIDEYRQDFIDYADYLFFSSAHVDPDSLEEYTNYYLECNPDLEIVIGLGAQGARYVNKENDLLVPAVNLDLPLIDTNGAGDSLATGFLQSHLFSGNSIKESLIRGQINARFTCSIQSSITNLLSASQLERYYLQVSSH